MAQKLLVVGGNGFLGSAVCKAAVARGWQVSSVSSSGNPYVTPKGHAPSWTRRVQWHKGTASDPTDEPFKSLLRESTAVVHTLGILLEGGRYKSAVRESSILGLAGALAQNLGFGESKNPLEGGAGGTGSYEDTNRDSALRVFDTYRASPRPESMMSQRTFVYVSAEDVFRPFVPQRYIETKRQAERELALRSMEDAETSIRTVFIRPGLMYHAHLRPLTTPIATLQSLSASFHASPPFRLPLPLPATALRALASASSPNPLQTESTVSPTSLESIANALEIPPMHVDHVGQAICFAVERADVSGPVGVRGMRDLIGWKAEDADSPIAQRPTAGL